MGNISIGKIISPCFKKKEMRIQLQGLDDSGKTTILHYMSLGEVVTTIPTVGYNMQTTEDENVFLTTWVIWSCTQSRPLLRHHFSSTQAIIFVIDSSDRERMDEVRDKMTETINEADSENCVFAVVANKQDLSNAMTLPEVRAVLKLEELFGEKRIYELFGTSANEGEGLYELFDWIENTVMNETRPSVQNDVKEIASEPEKDNEKLSFLTKPLCKLKEFVWL